MKQKIDVLGYPIENIKTKEIFSLLDRLKKSKKCTQVATINPEFLVYAEKNPDFSALLKTTTNIVDGVGIVYMARFLEKKKIYRTTGVHLAQEICHYASKNDLSVYFLGGFGVANKAAEKMKSLYPELKVAGCSDGSFQDPKAVIEATPDIILVAFGSPKQEYWIHENKDHIPSLRIAVGVGGTFDFWANKVERAPQWMQKSGLEWLFRLIKQPSRWKRILNAVVIFPLIYTRKFDQKD